MLDIVEKYPDIHQQLQTIHDHRLSAYDNNNAQK
jgi:hypothetical protein